MANHNRPARKSAQNGRLEADDDADPYFYGNVAQLFISVLAVVAAGQLLYSTYQPADSIGLSILALPVMWLCVPLLLVALAHTARAIHMNTPLPPPYRKFRLIACGTALVIAVTVNFFLIYTM